MKDWKYINGAEVWNSLVLRDGKYIIEQLEQSSTDKYAEKYFGMKKGNYCLKNTKTGVVLGWYTTLDAAKKSMEKWKDDDRVWGNSKTGNAIYSELNKDDKRVVIESDGSWYVYDKNDKIVEQGRELSSDNAFGKFKAKGYNKKVCNQDGVDRMFEGLVKDENKETEKDSGAIEELETGNSYTEADRKRLYELAKKQKTTKLTDAEWKEFQDLNKREEQASRELLKKTGNYATGKSKLKPGDKVSIYGSKGTVKEIIGENTDNIYGEPLIKVELESGKTVTMGEHYCIKVGNAGFDLRDPDPRGSIEAKAREAAQKQQKEEEEKKKRIDGIYKDKDGHKWRVSYRFGPGVRDDNKDGVQSAEHSDTQKLMAKIPDGFVKISNSQTGNASSDDKFSYVMREFEAGKLKTPDGKVVTDPEQAKAIAYSESKKTENGLARARKAIH